MLGSSTHDTKRSEDVRARLAVLSELASGWRMTLRRWNLFNKAEISRSDEYHFYQALIGIWPGEVSDGPGRAAEGLHAEGGARGEGAHELDQPGHRVRGRARAFRRAVAQERGVHRGRERHHGARRAARPAGRPVAGAGQGRLARRAGLLPGHRAVGLQPGRSRQPAAGRLRAAKRSMSRRTGDGRDKLHVIRKGLEVRQEIPGAVPRREVHAALRRRRARGEHHRLRALRRHAFGDRGRAAPVREADGAGGSAPLGKKAWGDSTPCRSTAAT